MTMNQWSARQLFIFVLAVFVTVGMSQSTVQAINMTAKMTMASQMDGSVAEGCQACPAGDDDGIKAAYCAVACVPPILAVFPQSPPVILARKPVPSMARYPVLHGRTSPPDLHPPRPNDIS